MPPRPPFRSLPVLIALAALALVPHTSAETGESPEPRPAAPEKPAVKDLGDGKYQAGLVTFDSTTRKITFPCTVNMTEGKLEYAIVHEDGKIHESILSTQVNALNLNVALKLLGFKESPELFPILDENYKSTGQYPEVAEETKAAARVEILLTWTDASGKPHSAALNDWITHEKTNEPLTAAPWVYGGSYLHRGVFQAKAMGDIAAIFTSRAALFNYPGKDREDDEVWIPTTRRIPPVGTPVTVTIQSPVAK